MFVVKSIHIQIDSQDYESINDQWYPSDPHDDVFGVVDPGQECVQGELKVRVRGGQGSVELVVHQHQVHQHVVANQRLQHTHKHNHYAFLLRLYSHDHLLGEFKE